MVGAQLIPLYVFIDESGDFNFSPSGTKYYTITAIITHNPWEKVGEAVKLQQMILSRELLSELGEDYLNKELCHCFHACVDKQPVRDLFFEIIQSMNLFIAHSIVVRKNKTNPAIQKPYMFYPKILGYLLDYIFKKYAFSKLCILVSGMPVNKHKQAFLHAVKTELKNKKSGKEYFIYFPKSGSNLFLQVSDYVNWAIFRRWERSDPRSYDLIKQFLGTTELDIFLNGDCEYYQFKN